MLCLNWNIISDFFVIVGSNSHMVLMIFNDLIGDGKSQSRFNEIISPF